MAKTNNTNQGSALLTALFIMTLVAIVATAMSAKLQVDIYRTRLTLTHDKLYLASKAVKFWAVSELNDRKNQFNSVFDNGIVSQYPNKMKNIYPLATLSGELYDLQARFNLNNLSNKNSILGFANFLAYMFPKITVAEKMHLASAITYWVSSNPPEGDSENFLSYYHHLKPAYNPSHQLMGSSSELRLIKGVSPQVYLTLEPYVTALPEPTPLNITTASMPALMSLNNTMNEKTAKNFIKARKKNEDGTINIEKINELLKTINITNDQFTLESTYFLSVAHAAINNLNITVYTVLKRTRDKNGNLSTSIVRESVNIF